MSKSLRILTLALIAITVVATCVVLFADFDGDEATDTAAHTTAPSTTTANSENPPAESSPAAPEQEAPAEEPAPAEPTGGEVPPPAEEEESPAPLAFAASIDGEDFAIPDPRVECVQDPTFTQVTVSSADQSVQNFAAFQVDGEQRVVSVSMSDGSPVTLTVESMTGEGKATGEINGGNYKISGEGWNIDYSNPGDHTVKPFTMEVTCP